MAPTSRPASAERLDELLLKTSRTFALSIPVLPQPTRREVTVAYLLFRIADTLEDATEWLSSRKLGELDAFGALLRGEPVLDSARLAARWSDPTFPLNFPFFGTAAYWNQQTTQLREQREAMAG